MGVRTKDYFLLGVEIDFYQHPALKELSGDAEFQEQYEGLANANRHTSGQMVHLYDETTGILTVGYAIAVKGETDDTIGIHRLTEENLTRWRNLYEPLVREHVEQTYAVHQNIEFTFLTHFW